MNLVPMLIVAGFYVLTATWMCCLFNIFFYSCFFRHLNLHFLYVYFMEVRFLCFYRIFHFILTLTKLFYLMTWGIVLDCCVLLVLLLTCPWDCCRRCPPVIKPAWYPEPLKLPFRPQFENSHWLYVGPAEGWGFIHNLILQYFYQL